MSERSTLLALSNSSECTSVADYNSTSTSEDDQQNCEPPQEAMESTGYQTVSKWVYMLVIVFGLSAWIAVNGLWVEMPLFVIELPEGWALPSYLVLIIQIANIGPMLYTLFVRIFPRHVNEKPVVAVIISIGVASCVLLSFFWHHTVYIYGAEHSVALFVLAGCLAFVDTTSSVVYLPYMVMFKPAYITALYFGEGLSGFIPGAIGLLQGVSSGHTCLNVSTTYYDSQTHENHTYTNLTAAYEEPLFSVMAFMYMLTALLILSGVAFVCLNTLRICKLERVPSITFERDVTTSPDVSESLLSEPNVDGYSVDLAPQTYQGSLLQLLIAVVWVNSLANGLMPSLMSYSCMPYGSTIYTLAVRLSTLITPVICFLPLFIKHQSLHAINILTLIGSLLVAYHVFLASQSPDPPFIHDAPALGRGLVLSSALLYTGCFTYVKVAVASVLRTRGKSALLWCGLATQLGSFIGATVGFILVNVLKLFVSAPPC